MSANFEKKQEIVEEIKQKVSSAKTLVFMEYTGLVVNNDIVMRREFKKNGCEYKVYKNRLVLRALNELGIAGFEDKLQGLLGVAFGYNDEVSVAKIAKKTVKENPKMAVKFGLVDNAFADEANIMALAELPSKEELIAKLLGSLNSTATRLCSVLNGPVRGLCVSLNAIAEQK